MYMSLVQKDEVSARPIPPREGFSVLETPWSLLTMAIQTLVIVNNNYMENSYCQQ